jgi:hypothetical protein
MAFVLSFIFKVYKDIIEVNNTANIDKTYQYFINISLESRRRVRKPERHNDVFVILVTGTKRRLSLVVFTNSDTIINIPKIEFKNILISFKRFSVSLIRGRKCLFFKIILFNPR